MLGKKLKELRGIRTQEEVAIAINSTQQKISNYEKEIVEPDNETLKKLAIYYKVSIDYLLDKKPLRHEIKILTEEELDLIQFFRSLSPEEKIRFKIAQELVKVTYEQVSTSESRPVAR